MAPRPVNVRRTLLVAATTLSVLLVAPQVWGAVTSEENTDRDLAADHNRQMDAFAAQLLDHEELIADCMAGKGWDYVPALPGDFVLQRANVLAEANGQQFNVDSVNVPADPSQAIIAGLTEADRVSRAVAYWGDEEAGGSDPGCYWATYEEVFGVLPVPDAAQLGRMQRALAADPRVVQARAEYSACMAKHGYQVSDPESDIFRIYRGREEELAESIRASGADPADSELLAVYRAATNVALAHHDECVRTYHAVEDTVKVDILKAERSGQGTP